MLNDNTADITNEKITAIILAAGRGNRMNSTKKKQFMTLGGVPLICHCLRMFQNSTVDNIILVTSEEDIDFCRKEIVDKYKFDKVSEIVPGGAERFDSVYNGLLACEGAEYIFIHDGARPFATTDMLERLLPAAREYGSSTVAMPVKDTIKISDDNDLSISTPDRRYVWQVQTPQCFRRDMLLDAYRKMYQSDMKNVTDDTMVAERYASTKTKLVSGSYENIKITTCEDMELAEILLKKRCKTAEKYFENI